MSAAAPPKILVVVPHPDVARALITTLTYTLHVETFQATDADEVDNQLSRINPNLIFIDTTSRELDAVALVAKLRARPATCHVPIVAIHIGEPTPDTAQEIGSDHILPLPFRASDVVAAVRKFLDVRGKVPVDQTDRPRKQRRRDRSP